MVKRRRQSRHVALLRAVNVGGKNLLPMKDLAELFIDAGCSAVRTYIQSGNVIVSAAEDSLDVITEPIRDRIWDRFGHRPVVIWRSTEQLGETIQGNPFPQAVDSNALHVLFLAGLPDPHAIGSLDSQRSPPDEFEVRARDVHLHVPNGMGRTKLTNAYFDSKLKISSTARNWRTTLKLFELMKEG